jgi:aminotransferase
MTVSQQMSEASGASKRSQQLGVSGIRAIFERAQTFPDIVRLEFGEPDFDTPQNIKDAAIHAIATGRTKYTSGSGIIELRKAISRKLESENQVSYDPKKEIVVSAGATAGINLALQATLDEGDEILVPNPGWATYVYAVKLVGAIPVLYDLRSESSYSFERETVERLVTPRTKAILINSPSNPMGSVFSQKDLQAVADFSKDHDLKVLSDEVYEKFIYQDSNNSEIRHTSIASLPDMKYRSVTINSFSKTYAMTGWRVGYVAANESVADAMAKINTAAASCISSISQSAALEALEGPQDSVGTMIEKYRERRDTTVRILNEIRGFHCNLPRGAFYAFPQIRETGLNSTDLSMKILEQAHVSTVPGSAFGSKGEGHIRIAYANSLSNIQLALERISKIMS